MEKEIRVGDRVRVADYGKTYNLMGNFFKVNKIGTPLNWTIGAEPKNKDEGVVKFIGIHRWQPDKKEIALIEVKGKSYIIHVEGLEKLEEEKPTGGNFKVRCTHGVLPGIFFTTGKIYEIEDGVITLDDGRKPPNRYSSIKDLEIKFASKFELANGKQTIIIYPQGTETIAILKEGKNVVKTAKAKYNPNDEKEGLPYKFEIGAELAMKRLLGKEDAESKTSFDWESFKKGEIAVHCDTEEKAKAFLKECDEQGLRWNSGSRISVNTFYGIYRKNTCYSRHGMRENNIGYCTLDYFKEKRLEILEYELPYREVKRRAKVGEWIKIVSNGKKGKVLTVGKDGRICAEHEKIWKYSSESRPGYEITDFNQSVKYVVLENYKGDF